MRIAVIGAGISGLGAALSLSSNPSHDVIVFEAADRPGGHANTLDIRHGGHDIAVDTGFIVYNELNYPNLTALFTWAGIATAPSDMSFSVSANDGAFEWCGRHERPLSGFFAQKRHLVSPGHWLFLREILGFQSTATRDLHEDSLGNESLAAYLTRRGFSHRLRDDYIVPMGAAIWSMTPREVLEFPVLPFLRFFDNHKLLQWDRPVWRTVAGGSKVYVEALSRKLGTRLRAGLAIRQIRRAVNGLQLQDVKGAVHHVDAVVLATHAPEALAMLDAPSPDEQAILGAFRTSENMAVLHADTRLMPHRRAAWAAWNLIRDDRQDRACVSYWMNRLQPIASDVPLFVTLNPIREPAANSVYAEVRYRHPIYDAAAITAQSKLGAIQGRDRIWFAGAWTGHGFHEDGLSSGLRAAQALGGMLPWAREAAA